MEEISVKTIDHLCGLIIESICASRPNHLSNLAPNRPPQCRHRSAIPAIPEWWLHANEASSILCVVSGHICAFFLKTNFQALFILLCKIKHYHTIYRTRYPRHHRHPGHPKSPPSPPSLPTSPFS